MKESDSKKFQCDCEFCKKLSPEKVTHKLCANKTKNLVTELKKGNKLKLEWSKYTDRVLANKYSITKSTIQHLRRNFIKEIK